MNTNKELINLTSLLDFSNKLTQNLSEEFIINSTLFTIIGKLGICGLKVVKIIDGNESETYSKGKLQCEIIKEDFIRINDKISFRFYLGDKLIGSGISDLELQYVKLILSIATTALENYYNFKELQIQKVQAEKKSQLLETLFEISRSFSGLTSEEKIIKALAFNIMGQLTTDKFAVVKTNEATTILKNNLNISDEELSNLVPKLGKIKLNSDLDKQFKEKIKIITPMNISGKTEGYLLIGPKMFGDYDEQDYSFVLSLATTAISALENERLIQEEIEKKRLETELGLATEIQNKLLPPSKLETDKFCYFGLTHQSNEVGGDYFDYVKISENKYLFVIADVTGKGMPAALIMSNIQAAIQSLAPIEKDLKALVNAVNKVVYYNTSKDMFITAFFCLLDTNNNTIEYINAGHFYPILTNNGKLKELRIGGVILGFIPSPIDYNSEILPFEDSLVMYTDGLNEAKDPNGNDLGIEGVKKIVAETTHLSPEKAVNYILDSVKKYTDNHQLEDDISIVVLKRK
ncbi:MAG: PP2C family protein-serine/threonine phosphatase [Candidatus Kapaibacterium sp.]|nr:PP2C family protein-serine/threonine phosphatase [Ignavibacteria bacterium]